MKKKLRRLWLRLVPTYRRLELLYIGWDAGDRLIRETANLAEPYRWVIAEPEEGNNRQIGNVWLERRERIWE